MEDLIIHCHTIFDEQLPAASHASSPPLPPAPLEETEPPHAYGSAHTKFSEYESQHQFDAPLPQTPTPQTTGDDFTPQPPPQPPASIHPSSRGNTGSSNGHSNTSPILTEAEINVSSPISYTPSPPLPLRPGRQGAPNPTQSLKGTEGLDFSQRENHDGGWIGPPPASPPLSDPPSPPSAFKSPQIQPPSSALPHSTFAHQQQQPVLTKTPTQEQQQSKAQPLLSAVERIGVGGLEPVVTPPEAPLSSTVDDSNLTESYLTPDPPGGPALRLITSRPLTQQMHQAPIQATEAPDQFQRSPAHSLRQLGEVPQDRHESQDGVPPS